MKRYGWIPILSRDETTGTCQNNNRPHISIDWILTFHPPWHKQQNRLKMNGWKMIHFLLGPGLFFIAFQPYFRRKQHGFPKHLFCKGSLGRCHQGRCYCIILHVPRRCTYSTQHLCVMSCFNNFESDMSRYQLNHTKKNISKTKRQFQDKKGVRLHHPNFRTSTTFVGFLRWTFVPPLHQTGGCF